MYPDTLQGRTAAADDEASEVEESQSSSDSEAEEEVYSEAEAIEVDDKPARAKALCKAAFGGKISWFCFSLDALLGLVSTS